MDHPERVMAALEHRETDRVPIDLGSTIVTTTTREADDSIEAMYQAALAQGVVPA